MGEIMGGGVLMAIIRAIKKAVSKSNQVNS